MTQDNLMTPDEGDVEELVDMARYFLKEIRMVRDYLKALPHVNEDDTAKMDSAIIQGEALLAKFKES